MWTREQIVGPMAAARHAIDGRAISAIVSVLLTGETAAPLAFVTPRLPFAPSLGQLGAIELVAGAGALAIDDAAFPVLADPVTSVRGFGVVGGGVNWFLTRGVAVLTSYGHQMFRAAAGGVRRPDEDVVIARLQLVL